MSKKMHAIKDKLFEKYGKRCEVCKRKFKAKGLTGHHIVPKSCGGEISEDNILITCYQCHFEVINNTKYDTKEYWDLMNKSLAHRKESDVACP